MFREGEYAEVIENTRRRPTSFCGIETLVLAYARLGRRDEALQMLEACSRSIDEFHRIGLSMSVLSNGLVPAVEETAPLVALGEPFMEQAETRDEYSRFVFLCYKGLYYLHKGAHQLAEAIFVALIGDPSFSARSRMFSRTRCYLAELYRRLGRRDDALQWVNAAAATHRAEHLHGDSAIHSLPLLAKLTPDADETARLLGEAEAILRVQRNDLGLAYILCLRARRLRDASHRQEIERLLRTIPALTNCSVARRIVSEWDSWIGADLGIEPVDYWGL
jgi:tetratricopeptide (TPR) repeat protein